VGNSSENTAVGNYSGQNNTSTDQVMVGYSAGQHTTSGAGQTFVGHNAGKGIGGGGLLTGTNNTAIGRDSGLVLQGNAFSNSFYGASSGIGVTTGDKNTYIGNSSGYYMTTGSENTILGGFDGNQNGLDIRTASNNVVLADGAGNIHIRSVQVSSTQRQIELNKYGSGSSNQDFMTFLGRDSSQPADANSHGLILSNGHSGAQAKFYAYGQGTWTAIEFLNTHGHTGQQIGSIKLTENATAFNTSSDYRLKENVDYTWDATTRLKQLKPARFNWISDSTNTLIDGFLAHEVSSIVPEAISGDKDAVDADGNPDLQGIDQSKLVPLLVKAIQELEARIATLEG
jgi:hypothetical protein